jgi:hypothetical protein
LDELDLSQVDGFWNELGAGEGFSSALENIYYISIGAPNMNKASNRQYYAYGVIFTPYIWYAMPFPCVTTRKKRANGTVTYVTSVYA